MQRTSLPIFLSLLFAITTTLPIVTGAPLPSSLIRRDEYVDVGASTGQGFTPYEPSDLRDSMTNKKYDAAVAADQAGTFALAATKAEQDKGEKTWSRGSMWSRIGLLYRLGSRYATA